MNFSFVEFWQLLSQNSHFSTSEKTYVSPERHIDQEKEQVVVVTLFGGFLSQVWRPGCPLARQEQWPRKKQDGFYDTQEKT